MYWEVPQVLLALWLLPLVAWLLVRAEGKRRTAAERLVDPRMAGRLLPPRNQARSWVKGGLILAGLALLIIAGARPRFGVYFEKLTQRGADLFVLLDVSRSMLAEDVLPNRLQRAKSDIRDLLGQLAGDRVGLVVFAGRPVVKVPLTSDLGFLLSALDEVGVHSAPRGGSLIGDGIRKCLEAMPERRDRDQVIVLITDGEDHDSYPEEAAKQAHQRGVKIFTVGLGDSREGSRVPVRDASGGLSYLQHGGVEVWSKVDERLLKEIALTTEGAYVPAGTRAYDLGRVYRDHLAKLTRSEYQAEKRKRYREQFQLFVCLGAVLLLAEMAIARYRQATGPAIGAGLRRGLAALVLAAAGIGLPGTVWSAAPDAAEMVRQGIAFYAAGDYKGAAAAFSEADVARPDDPRIAFDRAAVLGAQGDADKATGLLRKAAEGANGEFSARCHYNRGCLAAGKARARFGEKPEEAGSDVRQQGLTLLAEAVGHFRDCLRFQPQHADARYNLELLRVWMKQMQALWSDRDRKKAREELDLLAFLRMLDARQRELRGAVQAIQGEADSPKRRQAVAQLESAQRALADEIGPLNEKIRAAAAPPATPGAKAAALTPDQTKAVEALTRLAEDAGKAMKGASDHLRNTHLPEAVSGQAGAVENLDEIYRAAVPLAGLVARSVATQAGLVEQSAPTAKDPKTAAALNGAETAWQQKFVAGWAEALAPKARQESARLEAGPAAGGKPGAPAAGPPDPEASKQEQSLKQAYRKAIESGPKIRQLADAAANSLRQKEPAHALPKQQEALRLLKEIADLLPKQQQKPQEEGDKQSKGDQKPPEEKPGGQQPKQQSGPSPKELSQAQAEAALRQARQRQQHRQELEKEVRSRMYRPDPVEKDW